MELRRATTVVQNWYKLLLLSLLYHPKISNALDTITAIDSIRDGDTIISSGGNFEMGFFGPENSNYRYLGIWYKKISSRTVVWVANRETPLLNKSGTLKVINPGILVILNDTKGIIWHTNTSRTVQNPVAQLLDSGNLVVKGATDDDSAENFLWQSFDYPTDTVLPDMKIGKNFATGRDWYLSSWKSIDDPALGGFTYHCDPSGYPQNFIRRGALVQYRSGPWNGLRFSGGPNSRENRIYSIDLVYNEKEVYFTYHPFGSAITRFVINQSGVAQRWMWINRTQGWILYLAVPSDNCDSYKLCGPYGTCRIEDSPVCDCLDKFVPKYPDNWKMADWSSGCVRRRSLDCQNGDGFFKYAGVKLPDTRNAWYNKSMTLEECKLICLKNCSCIAYANSDIRNGGSGCLLWFEDLIDIREVTDGQDIYIRIASSELGSSGKKRKILKVILPLSGMLLFGLCYILYIQKQKRGLKQENGGRKVQDYKKEYNDQHHDDGFELQVYDLATITKATNNFSQENKLGEGGYGPVYKGVLGDGQEIAVKRLSETSTQGLDEFKNEVLCIAKLQHRNLVKLLGCCVQGEEKMLIYEYMHNKSLDSLIFDQIQSKLLDWPTRFHIINGIARGLMYLHQDSRLRIIHRDLKASNILLDTEMNPKISDFGMARSFRGNETGAKTSRVIGTYGYMSPEYAVHGHFSVKSDVFSFGVSVLEIVSGKRNRGFFHPDHSYNLLGHAWILYKEDRSIELVDANLGDSFHLHEVLRSIHVALLCVQQSPQHRPDMSSVVLMLSSEGVLPKAKQPGFFTVTDRLDGECSSRSRVVSSTNDISNTILEPR